MASWDKETETSNVKTPSVTGIQFKYHDPEPTVSIKYKSQNGETTKSDATTESYSIESNGIQKSKHTDTYLDLNHVDYSVSVYLGPWWKGACFRKQQNKHILRDITIRVQSGHVSAVLGNSGSGKTTLLDVIAGRTVASHQGKVTYCGQTLTPQMFRKHAGYVIQADRLIALDRMLPDLTVKEVLTYTARLKFLDGNRDVNIEERVSLALNQMGMRHLADSIVGGVVKRGISGGEKRRLSIATQLIQDPAIILLDEPTTGLDSFTAHNLIKTLSTLAKEQNKIVLLSIHQPRSDIFRLFDSIGILSFGEMVYYGARDKLVSHFGDAGYPCPTYVNPLDHYVDLASIDNRSEENQVNSKARVGQLKGFYMESSMYKDMVQDIKDNSSNVSKAIKAPGSKKNVATCTFLQQAWILYCRMNVNIWRNKIGMVARIATLWTFGFLCLLFLGRLGEDLTTIQDRTGLFFECISAAPLVGMLNGIALFPTMRDVYHRESGDGLYKASPFLAAYYVHIIPFHIIATFIFACTVYWGCGLYPEASRFFIFFAVIGIIHYTGEIITVLALALFSNPPLAQSLVTLTFAITSLLATGLLRSSADMLAAIDWIRYISFYKYATEILMANEYQGLTFTCEDGDDRCDVIDGETYLEVLFPSAVENMTENAVILSSMVAVFWVFCIMGYSIRGIRNLY